MKDIKNKLLIYEDFHTEKQNNEYFYIDVSDKDTIMFYVINTFKIHTYQFHKYCGGDISFRNIKKYNILYCDRCNLRVEIPQYIKTITELKKYFDKKNGNRIKKFTKFEIMDLED